MYGTTFEPSNAYGAGHWARKFWKNQPENRINILKVSIWEILTQILTVYCWNGVMQILFGLRSARVRVGPPRVLQGALHAEAIRDLTMF